jgi:deazaflavin-dependent oxidoreductase (nitroreductase family)
MSDWNQALIDELRANGGRIAAGPMAGRPLLILTSTGARSGRPREAVLTYTRDGDRYVVAGSAGGAPTAPSWFHNVLAEPEVRVEAGGRTFRARAAVADEAERRRLWERHVAARPEFADYPERSGRVIPVVTLQPLEPSETT